MLDLIAPHGGLKEPIDRTVPAAEIEAFREKAGSLPRVPISDADLSSLYRFGDGGLSPLTGPMSEAAFQPSARRGGIRLRRQQVCLDHPDCVPG